MDFLKQLSDDELKSVVGGIKTGEIKDDKVYLNFPLILSNLSGWYNCEEIEALCSQYISFKSYIKPYIDSNVRIAVVTLYNNCKKDIPDVVKELLGI